ncbi:MAG: hypothetical protein ACXADB_10520 [Candidatus Hermodarchaeia archaeon]|jgi:hypothetical protein
METPYTPPREKLDEVIRVGEEVRETLIKATESRGNITAAETFGKIFFQEHSRAIGSLGRVFRSGTKVSEYRADVLVGELLLVLRDLIDDLPTGRRKSELKLKQKREFLKKLAAAAQRKSVGAKLNAILRLANEISTVLTSLEVIWTPRSKLIPSGRYLKGKAEIEEIFASQVRGFLWVCDPYTSPKTLSMIEATSKDIPITLLTATIHNREKFNMDLQEMRSRGYRIDVFLLTNGPRTAPHDRYIIDDRKGWSVGTSLKDIGNRDASISHIDNRLEVIQMIEEYIAGLKGPVNQV